MRSLTARRGWRRGAEASALDVIPREARHLLREATQPPWVDPMLATLTDQRFSDPRWIFERKLDGERCLAFRLGRAVRLASRNRLDVTAQYPELEAALTDQRAADFVLDGEIVAFDGAQTSFARLQQRMHVGHPTAARVKATPVFFYLFDAVHAEGHDLTAVPLRFRKRLLATLLDFSGHGSIRLTPHRNERGESLYREACAKGWEGLIAKRADSPYEHGRSKAWLKFKCVNEQEFVIVGYTDPQGSRQGFGALLLGYHDGGRLRFAGKVGTGFDANTLRDLLGRLEPLRRDASPIAGTGLPRKGVHWVEPQLVGQIGFSEWTTGGQLRHPRFLGLRQDKRAAEVVRERPG